MDLTDQQWTIIEPLFEEKRRPDGRGRPWRDARAVLNGVLWVLRTGAPWHDLPAVPNLPSAVPAVLWWTYPTIL
jgi:transposase